MEFLKEFSFSDLDIEKFSQYNLKIKYTNIFHYRFIIIDNYLYKILDTIN